MTSPSSAISPSTDFTPLTLATTGSTGCQVDNHRGMKSTIINSLQRVANSVQPVIRPICIVTLSMASIGIVVFTKNFIAATIRDISSPEPVTPNEILRLEHARRDIGTDLGTLGGFASGLTIGLAISLYKKNVAPHLSVGLPIIVSSAIGAVTGKIYSYYVDHLPGGVDN
ncbi:hypothetical protein [Acerihabitans arboris]|uniref:Uncharacterized protein n=1 Tax=Acerihabitans arboris TaxID=2691583 RepID=A0A845SIZ7_9GAMM|nr:hypothetical protein [Acerihabitans arboris]NDL64890.1 hypothetical protein [Acerihabitans arboris]